MTVSAPTAARWPVLQGWEGGRAERGEIHHGEHAQVCRGTVERATVLPYRGVPAGESWIGWRVLLWISPRVVACCGITSRV